MPIHALTLQEDLDNRFRWDPSNARWVRVKPGKDEQGTALPGMHMFMFHTKQRLQSFEGYSSIQLGGAEGCGISLIGDGSPGKYSADNWEKGGVATITPLSGSPYVVSLWRHRATRVDKYSSYKHLLHLLLILSVSRTDG